eukprot:jgi/Hompol1/540/HPOL_001626-RA
MYRRSKPGGADFRDITALLDRVPNELELGELLMSKHTTMMDLMHAVPIMEPRMDSGLDVPSEKDRGKLATCDVRFKTSWTLPELTALCDRLLALQMDWLCGQLAAQTVFTCVYLHDIPNEEDFQPDLSGFSLEPHDDSIDPDTDLVLLIDHIDNALQTRDFAGLKETVDAIDYGTSSEKAFEDLAAIKHRFDFLRQLTTAISSIEMMDDDEHDGSVPGIAEAKASLDSILKSPSDSFDVNSAFDDLVNRKLFTQYPIKQALQPTVAQRLSQWMSMLNHIQEISSWPRTETMLTILDTLEQFCLRNPDTNTFTRSFQLRVLSNNHRFLGTLSMYDHIKSLLGNMLNAPYDKESSPHIYNLLEDICRKAAEVFGENLRIFCFNRARQRRRLIKNVMTWETVQQQFELLDVELHKLHVSESVALTESCPFYYASWAYYYKLRAVNLFYALGFELELYSYSEYQMVFLYVWYLHENRVTYVEHIRKLRASNVTKRLEEVKVSAEGSDSQLVDCELWLTFEEHREHVKQTIARAILNIASALRPLGLLEVVDSDTYSESTHYSNRFKHMAFLASPRIVSSESYLGLAVTSIEQVDTLVETATSELQTAKKLLEDAKKFAGIDRNTRGYKDEIPKLLRVCIANLVALKVFPWQQLKQKVVAAPADDAETKRLRIKANQRRVLFEFKYDKTFPVLARFTE